MLLKYSTAVFVFCEYENIIIIFFRLKTQGVYIKVKEKVIETLNTLLADELPAVNQYVVRRNADRAHSIFRRITNC